MFMLNTPLRMLLVLAMTDSFLFPCLDDESMLNEEEPIHAVVETKTNEKGQTVRVR